MARTYTKRSTDYWTKRSAPQTTSQPAAPQLPDHSKDSPWETYAAWDNTPHFTQASCGAGGSGTGHQTGAAGVWAAESNFPLLSQGLIPYEDRDGYYTVASAIELATRAYFNVPLIRNVIDMYVDFSCSNLHLRGKNKTARNFIKSWFKAVNIDKFVRGFFLEYYRSGNVFIYKYNGKIGEKEMSFLRSSGVANITEAAKATPTIPIRYTILNPQQIYLQKGAMTTNGWVRMLSTFEIARLKNPQTPEDKQVFNDLPESTKDAIRRGAAYRYVFAPLDQSRFYYAFFHKQDYEPLGVPMVWPVLPDVEWKLTLKAMDMSLSKTMEQVLLLVTTGRAADQYNPRSSAKNIEMMQNLFANQTIGRVLVSDYTTKAEWHIPDLKGLLGKDKYDRVNEDIKEGLQFVFFATEKFANASVKARLMIEFLREGRRAFINDFLQPEIDKISETMGFKGSPQVEFEDINFQDEAVMRRLYVSMAQLGFLTPDELNEAITTGLLPSKEDSIAAQEELKTLREQGLYLSPAYNPGDMTGGDGRPSGAKNDKPIKKSPIGQKKAEADLDPVQQYAFGALTMTRNLMKMNELREAVEEQLRKRYKIKVLDEAQSRVAMILARDIVLNEAKAIAGNDEDTNSKAIKTSWKRLISNYIDKPQVVASATQQKVDEIERTFEVDSWSAVVLFKSQVEVAKEAAI
jgi:hypothetical protein